MNKFVILLTCCVSPLYCDKKNIEKRKALYLKVIHRWLERTNFEIYCVDSSGYEFNEIENDRFHNCHFVYKTKDPHIGKSNGESKSILKAYKKFNREWKREGVTHIIKITGRYYLEDLEKWTESKKRSRTVLWTQQDCLPFLKSLVSYFLCHVNSEIFILKRSEIWRSFYNKDKNILMERHLYLLEEKYGCKKLPRFKNTLRSRRGGDNLIIEYL